MAPGKGTIFVTGANGGLGSNIVKLIVSNPELAAFHGLYAVRDPAAAPALNSALASNPSHPHNVLSLDLTNLNSVRQKAETIKARISAGEILPIRALILNAGALDFGKQTWTEDKLDTTFSANYLGHWLLVLLLLGSMDREYGRIVVIGSQAHDPYDKRNDATKAFLDDKYKEFIHDEDSFEAIAKGTWSSAEEDPSYRSGYRRYGAAKMFLIMMIHELQGRMDKDPILKNVSIIAVDPGTMSTGLQRKAPWFIRILLFQIIYPIVAWLKPNGPIHTAQKSAGDILQLALDASPGVKGQYYNGTVLSDTSEEARDERKRGLVWRQSVLHTRLKKEETILDRL